MKREVCPKCGSSMICMIRVGLSCRDTPYCEDCEKTFLMSKIFYDPIKCFDCRVPFTPKDDGWYCPDCIKNIDKQHKSPEFYFPKSLAQWEQAEVDKGAMDQSDVVIE